MRKGVPEMSKEPYTPWSTGREEQDPLNEPQEVASSGLVIFKLGLDSLFLYN